MPRIKPEPKHWVLSNHRTGGMGYLLLPNTSPQDLPEVPDTQQYGTVFVAMHEEVDTISFLRTMKTPVNLDGSAVRATKVTDDDRQRLLRSAPDGLLAEENGKLVVFIVMPEEYLDKKALEKAALEKAAI